jgi:hypothetical protein
VVGMVMLKNFEILMMLKNFEMSKNFEMLRCVMMMMILAPPLVGE